MTTSMTVGRFSFSPTAARWVWSDEMYALHGMAHGDVVPTRALFLSHVHTDDRDRVEDVLEAEGAPRGCAYRLIDLVGKEHSVLIACAPTEAGGSGEVQGFVVDDSQRQSRLVATAVNDQLKAALASHAVIDQAKGMLMLTYGIDDATAFDLMRSASQQRNVRLRVLAERLVRSARSLGVGPELRSAVDDLFVNAIENSQPAGPTHGNAATVELDDLPSGPRLRVHGSVDVTAVPELTSALSRLLEAGRARGRVLVDLSDVPEIGAAALDALRAAQRRCASREITMEVVGTAADVGTRIPAPEPSSRPGRNLVSGHP